MISLATIIFAAIASEDIIEGCVFVIALILAILGRLFGKKSDANKTDEEAARQLGCLSDKEDYSSGEYPEQITEHLNTNAEEVHTEGVSHEIQEKKQEE